MNSWMAFIVMTVNQVKSPDDTAGPYSSIAWQQRSQYTKSGAGQGSDSQYCEAAVSQGFPCFTVDAA